MMLDLDELVLRCKNDEARQYIREAVVSYKAGAYRACIVSTWIAVVYDFLYKLRQLDLTGDKNAAKHLSNFESARRTGDVRKALEFEKKILNLAENEFEFISPMQHTDLQRLLDDRNRCAHPSMLSEETIYEPTPEMARYHLRSAITHLLEHAPIQGKAAIERLKNDVDSLYFPRDTEGAIRALQYGPLAHPKDVLVRNFVLLLLKGLILEGELKEDDIQRYAAALAATREMHHGITEKTLEDKLSSIVERANDENLDWVVGFLSMIPDTYQYLRSDLQMRLENYLSSLSGEIATRVLPDALDIPELHDIVLGQINAINYKLLKALIQANPIPEFIPRAIKLYSDAGNFDHANDIAHHLINPLVKYMDMSHFELIVNAAIENSQVAYSYGFIDVLDRFHEQFGSEQEKFMELLEAFCDGYYDFDLEEYQKRWIPDEEGDESSL